jgi:phospholipase C
VVSPRARRGNVAHGTYDHTSILRAIEWRWGLPPLTPRDAHARNIAEVLDFGAPADLTAPTISVPPFVAAPPCALQELAQEAGPEASEWTDLKKLALSLNWSLPA